MPAMAPLLDLESVRWTSGDVYGVTFTTAGDDTGRLWSYATQLYADEDLTTTVGGPVAATVDGDGYGDGQWSPAMAGTTLPATGTYWLAVVVTGPGKRVGTSNALPLVRDVPALVGGTFDENALDVVWRPPATAAANAYVVAVVAPDGTALVEEVLEGPGFPGTQGGTRTRRLDLGEVAFALVTQPPTVVLTALVVEDGVSRGPSASAAFPALPPRIGSVNADPVTGATTLTWGALAGATGYAVTVGGTTTETTGTSATFTAPPAAVATVRATAGPWLGPLSTPVRLATVTPVVTSASYDAANVTASWTPVGGATGYAVTLLAGGAAVATHPAPAEATSATFAFAADRTLDHTLVVQALASTGSGPPSAPVPLVPPATYVSAAAAACPYVYTATTLALTPPLEGTPPDLTVPLPDVATKTPPQAVTKGPFTLAHAPAGPYTYLLTIGAAAWTFDGKAVRQGLKSDYVAFLEAAETATVTPQGIALIQQAIARAMPQTFDETLFYTFGLDLDAGVADLRPGTVLRVAAGAYTAVGDLAPDQWYDGWATGATADWDVVSYATRTGGRSTGVDAFVARLVAGGALQVQAPPQQTSPWAEGGVAHAADLWYDALRQPFLRLFVPTALQTPSGIGSTSTVASFAIGGAGSYTALGRVNPGPGSDVAYFRGRAVVGIAARVVVNGAEQVVPAGTTVGDVLDRYGARPQPVAAPLTGVTLHRAIGPVGGTAVGTLPVRLDWGDLPVYAASGRTALDLPLLPGDRLTVA